MVEVIERSTGTTFQAKAIDGGYEIYTLSGDKYKKVKESTFKRYFKQVEKPMQDQGSEEPKPTKEEPKPEKKADKPIVKQELDPEKREKMIDKIRKILKLAQDNPSMEEGLSAALQAQKLMAKYNIADDEVTLEEIKDEITSVFTHQKHNSHLLAWRKTLASIVARNFRCKTYIHGDDVVFRGFKQDAVIALDVYTALYNIGNRLGCRAYAEQMEETGTGRGAYNSCVTGFLSGVEEGLGEQCRALMVIVPKQVEDEFAEFSASFKHTKTSLKVTNARLYQKGKAEGKAAVKAREIETK